MCGKHNKYHGFQYISSCLLTNRVLDVLGKLFRHILEDLWCPWGNFGRSARVSKYHRKFVKFPGFPGNPGSEVTRQVEGKMPVQGGSKFTFQNILAVEIQAARLEAVNSQGQKDLQGCKLTNMLYWKDLQGCKLTNCKHIPHSLMAHKGPAGCYYMEEP